VKGLKMTDGDRLVERRVVYSIEYGGRMITVEDVPARLDPEACEELFSPETVERLQAIVWSDCR
jgi:hypothetical protein